MDRDIDNLPAPTKPRPVSRQRVEALMKLGISPIVEKFAAKHYPEITKGMLQDLVEGVADYIASSFESYQENIEDEHIEVLREETEWNNSFIKQPELSMAGKVTVDDL